MRVRASALTVLWLVMACALPGTGLPAEQHFASPTQINEFLADNKSIIRDEYGEYGDVLELYNRGPEAADLGGMYLTDPVRFPVLRADVSDGRQPDGTGDWGVRVQATPGHGNQTSRGLFLPLVARNAGPPRLFLPLVARAAGDAGPPPLALRIDCGSDAPYTTAGGTAFLGDREWGVNSAFGYVGGHQWVPTEWWEGWNPVGGTDDDVLYRTQRYGWREYRVSRIPNGSYLLTLRFDEQEVHGPGFNVFDVAVEGRTVLDNFDVYDQVGRYHALDRRFAVTVADGELNVIATPVAGEARLSALELVPRQRDSIAPAAPPKLAATRSYRAVLLDWPDNAEDDLAGYNVYRADNKDGPYTRLTAGRLAYLSRYQDNVDTPYVPYYYRVTAVDAFGNESKRSGCTSEEAMDMTDAALPLYQLQVSPQNLAILNADPWSDEDVPGVFAYAGQVIPAKVRFRGSIGRTLPKKSWKIKFPAHSPFPRQDRINVNANWFDNTVVHSKLATRVFEAAGVRPPQAEHVLLALNGEYMGVYTRNEQVDEGFLVRTGRNPGASIYKVAYAFAELPPSEEYYRVFYEKETNKDLDYTDLIAFIELINNTPDNDFPRAISAAMNVKAFLDYYAAIVLVADTDSASHNIYMIHDLATDKWEFVPWDMESTFWIATAPIDMGTQKHPVPPGGWNILRTRVLAVPDFRAYYCRRLAEYMDTIFADAVMVPQVDATYGAIKQDGLRDWRKWNWEENSSFLASPGSIKSFISQRREFLRGEMTTFCPAE